MISRKGRGDYRFTIGNYNPPERFVDFPEPSDNQLEEIVFPVHVAGGETVNLDGVGEYDTIRVELLDPDVDGGALYSVEFRKDDQFVQFGVGVYDRGAA